MNDIERIDKAVKAVCDELHVSDCVFINEAGDYLKTFIEQGITIDELPITLMVKRIKFERDTYYDLYRQAIKLLLHSESRTEEALGQFFGECQAQEFYIDNEGVISKSVRWIMEELAKDGQ
jgi:hypothetical protein